MIFQVTSLARSLHPAERGIGLKCAWVINHEWNYSVYIALYLDWSTSAGRLSQPKPNKDSQWLCHILLGWGSCLLPTFKDAIFFHESLFILETQFCFLLLLFIGAFFYLGISGKCVYSKITALDRGPHPDLKTGITAAWAERQPHQTLSSKGKWKAFSYCHTLSLPGLVDITLINKMWPGHSMLMCFGEGEMHVLAISGTTRSEVPRWL